MIVCQNDSPKNLLEKIILEIVKRIYNLRQNTQNKLCKIVKYLTVFYYSKIEKIIVNKSVNFI